MTWGFSQTVAMLAQRLTAMGSACWTKRNPGASRECGLHVGTCLGLSAAHRATRRSRPAERGLGDDVPAGLAKGQAPEKRIHSPVPAGLGQAPATTCPVGFYGVSRFLKWQDLVSLEVRRGRTPATGKRPIFNGPLNSARYLGTPPVTAAALPILAILPRLA